MSRAPPFPTNAGPNRTRSPPVEGYTNGSGTASPIRPLQISRSARPASPAGGASIAGSVRGPARPSRSDLRPRQPSDYDSNEPGSSRTSDYNQYPDEQRRPTPEGRSRNGGNGTPPTVKIRTTRSRSDTQDSSQAKSPQMDTVMSAFKSAGVRKRTTDAYDEEYEREKEQVIQEQKETQKRIAQKVPGRRRPKAGDIDAVLDQINDEWAFVKEDDFNPVDLALQLLDDADGGRSIDSFRRAKNMLSKSLKTSVDTYYQAFAQSVPQHSTLFNHMDQSQAQVKEARAALLDAKEALGNKRADLVQIWSRGQTIEEMIRILDQIENLKTIADLFETLISEKRFLQASVLLVQSLKLANKPDMQDIGAVSDLRNYLLTQESLLREILVEELHGHLYVRSFWCESRWSVYTPGQHAMPRPQYEDADMTPDMALRPESQRRPRLSRFLDDLAVRNNDSPYDINDTNLRTSAAMKASSGLSASASVSGPGMGSGMTLVDPTKEGASPEADSFAFLEMLLESLAVLGKLGNALDITAQRVPAEIYALTDATLDEVTERAEFARRENMLGAGDVGRLDAYASLLSTMSSTSSHLSAETLVVATTRGKEGLLPASALRSVALESSSKHTDHEILRDLFWTLYSKLHAVVQGLRIISEVVNRIGARRNFKDSSGAKPGSLFPLAEIWMPVNAEIRTLLNDYITDAERGAMAGINPISSINEVLREGKFSRDKAQYAFRFADTDPKTSSRNLREHEDELNRVLRDTVPGLVHTNAGEAVQNTLSALGMDERMIGAIQHHTLLVKPDAFHVSVLFQPTLAFLQTIADVLPSGMESARTSTAVLDEFVLKIYLPQLEDKVSMLFMQAVSSPEAFQLDTSSPRLSGRPLNKASMQLMGLINSLCVMLRSSPFHKENYARLILGVIIQFYQRCFDRFQNLVASKSSTRKAMPLPVIAAQWAQRTEIAPCLADLLGSVGDDAAKTEQLCRTETKLEMAALGQAGITKDQLISLNKDLAELCLLQHSVAWFVAELNVLRVSSDEPATPATPSITEPMSAITPFTPSLPQVLPLSPDDELKLPLSRESSLRFQALLKTYDLLAELILCTIRVDVRCRAFFHLELAAKEGNYQPQRSTDEPDAHIIDLNRDISDCDEIVNATLPSRQRSFVFEGLPQLTESLLISSARHIPLANELGIRKISRNITTLQQGLRMLSAQDPNVGLTRAQHYYSLFSVPPPDMLAQIRTNPVFTFDEYNTMLSLQCGVDQSKGEAGAQTATDRNYSMYSIDLHGMELEGSSG